MIPYNDEYARYDEIFSRHALLDESAKTILFKHPETTAFCVEFHDLGEALALYGDVDTAVFARFTRTTTLREKIHIIGRSVPSAYVSGKWVRGMGVPATVYEPKKAREDLLQLISDYPPEDHEALREALELLDDPREMWDALSGVDTSDLGYIGQRVLPRIICAHAACIAFVKMK